MSINKVMLTSWIFISVMILTLSLRVVFLKTNDHSSNDSIKNNSTKKHNFFFNIEGDMFYPKEILNITKENRPYKARISELKCIEYSQKTSESIWILKSTPIKVQTKCRRVANKLIAGGEATRPQEFPHMAALGKYLNEYSTEYFCAGSVISESWILTAAHCIDTVNNFPTVVLVGTTIINRNNSKLRGDQLVAIRRIVPHPEYHPPQLYADIGLIELSKPVSFNSALKPACLYSLPAPAPRRLWVSGWGASGATAEPATSERSLMKTRLRVLEPERCSRVLWDRVRLPRGVDGHTQMCAGDPERDWSSDTCAGDSGAPMQARHPLGCLDELFAVTSFGVACAVPGVPGVYTKIAPYIAWIESVVWQKDKERD